MAASGCSKEKMSKIDPDKPYPMTLPNLGHAVIINNVAGELPGSIKNVEALKTTYEKGMRKLKRWIMDNKTHEDSNTFLLTIICHGNKQGHLLDKNRSKAWDTEEFVGVLSEVETLLGKPKILVIQACRGSQWSSGNPVPLPDGALADDDELTVPHIVADKSDLFIAYATVPGYIAHGGDDHGSTYLQAFATYLREEYLQRPLDRIYLMVKQHMRETKQGKDGFVQCSEERNSLTHVLHFGQFHGVDVTDSKERHLLMEQMEKQEKEMKTLKDEVIRMKIPNAVTKMELEEVRRTPEARRKEQREEKGSPTRARHYREKMRKTTTGTNQKEPKTGREPPATRLFKGQKEKNETQKTRQNNMREEKEAIPSQNFEALQVELSSNYKPGMQNFTGFTVMKKSGVLVGHGQRKIGCPWYLFFLSPAWKEIVESCPHTPKLLSLLILRQEYLVQSCHLCCDIKVINIKTKEMQTAFSGPKVNIICEGEEKKLFVTVNGKNEILELDCSTLKFTYLRDFKITNKNPQSICYVPCTHGLLLVIGDTSIEGISCRTGEVTWTLKTFGTIASVYSPIHNKILAANGYGSKLLVLNPDDGTQVLTIQMPANVKEIRQMCLHDGHIIIKHGSPFHNIAYLSLKP